MSCLLAALRWGSEPVVLIPFLFFLPLLAGLAVLDLHTRRLPNVLTWPALLGGLLRVVGAGVVEGEISIVATALASGGLLFGVLLTLNLLRPSGMGMGDVKLAGLLLIGLGRITRRTPVPFGPWLAVGTLVAVLAGPELVQGYLAAVS